MTAHYRHLTLEDRIEIERLLEKGTSLAEIARQIGVHRSTISRERRRGSWQPEHDHANLRPYLRNRLDTRGPHERLYLGGQAQLHADTRTARSHQPYRMLHDQLVDWVISALRRGWTPAEISGRLPLEFPDDARMRVGVETLYAWIYAPEQKHRQLWQYLPRGQRKRRRRQGRRVHSERIKWTRSSPRSTTDPAESSAGQPPPRSSTNYAQAKPHHVAPRTRTRDRAGTGAQRVGSLKWADEDSA
ncbi:helix-turn-helix domain-containing protein [Microbacterium sp. KRD172]|uniref:helix-turn-helix domain-containing protein n=1 Tax=Microbacterium sp. KRD172 TaxID=2729727 RepID=UPI0019D19570|nr:helix-turn-helix domain-containing protein [Microbacterium sp. KRD172]